MAQVTKDDGKIDGGLQELATRQQFKEFVRKSERAVVKWTMDQCPPCRAIAPKVLELAKEHAGTVRFAEANASNPELDKLREEFDVQTAPTFLFFSNGLHLETLRVVKNDPKKLTKSVLTLVHTK